MHEFASATAKVLDSGRRVLVYSGKEDYICNYLGGIEWTNATKWSQQVGIYTTLCTAVYDVSTTSQPMLKLLHEIGKSMATQQGR